MTIVPFRGRGADAPRPTSLEIIPQVIELAKQIEGTDFVPKGLRGNPAAILAAILYGHEVGLEPMQSLAKISVIEGKPTLSAEAQRGLILAAGHQIWLEESTVTRAIWAGRRRDSDKTVRATWSMDDAKRARISGKSNWQAYPKQMLSARASADLARAMFADVIGGMAASEEMDEVMGSDAVDADTKATPPPKPETRKRKRAAPAPVVEAAQPDPLPPPFIEPEPVPDEPPEASLEKPAPDLGIAKARMFATFAELGISGTKERADFCTKVLDRKVTSSKDLDALDVSRVISALDETLAQRTPEQNEQEVIDVLVSELDAREVDGDGFERPPLPQ